MASLCIARQEKLWDEIPVKSGKKARRIEQKTVFVISGREGGRQKVALRKRPDEGLLASLYEFPNIEGTVTYDTAAEAAAGLGVAEERIRDVRPLGEAKHIFSHVEWHMTGYLILVEGELPETYVSADIRELEGKYPLPSAFLAYRKAFFKTK